VLSLFSGIGGLDLGISRALPEAEHVGMVEQNDFARDVLAAQFPGVPLHEDVIDVAADPSVVIRPNIVIGGFPCTDISAAKQGACGLEGASSGLYRQMADIVRATDPDWVVYENTPQLRSRGLEDLLADHRELGYELAWDGVPAESVGAPHERDRIFVVAHRPGVDFEFTTPERSDHWSDPGRVPVLPAGDPKSNPAHKEQLRAAGNAVAPQVGEHIGQLIRQSKPGERDLSGAQAVAVWSGTAWVDPQGGLFGAEPVTSWPRAGVMRGDTVYKVPTVAPRRHASAPFPVGQTVWVRNPDPRVEHPTTTALTDLTDAELQVLQMIRLEGEPSYEHEPFLSRLDPETDAERAVMNALVSRGYLLPDYSLSWVGDALGGNEASGEATWRRDRGGVGHENPGNVLEYNEAAGMAAVQIAHGSRAVVPLEWLSRYPTPATTDWHGGAPGDRHEWRKRGGQLRHWVTRQVSPEFSSHMMGLPPGWLDVKKSFDDIRASSWLLKAAEGRAAKGASEAAESAGAAPKSDGSKPPKGFVALKNSRKGGYRKRMANGGYVYWYPGKGGGKGKVTTKKHKSDIGTKDVLLSILEAALPPDKHPMIVNLRDLLEAGDADEPKDAPEKEPAAGEPAAGEPAAGEPAEPEIPAELKGLHEDTAAVRERAQTELTRHKLEQERARLQAVTETLTELAPGISETERNAIQDAIADRFGVPTESAPAEPTEPEPTQKAFAALVVDVLTKADRPPPGYSRAPGSKIGSYRRRVGNAWEYWDPRHQARSTVVPSKVFGAIREVASAPEDHGVSPQHAQALAQVVSLVTSLDSGTAASFAVVETPGVLGQALSLAAGGVNLLSACLRLARQVADSPDRQPQVTAFLKATIGVAYTAGALGAAAAISIVAPGHPIARHAREYSQAVTELAEDVSRLERAHRRVDYIVTTMGDADMGVSLGIISDALMKLKLMRPPPRIPRNVVEASLGMHHALQGLQDVIQGRPQGWAELAAAAAAKSFTDFIGEILWKARSTKYCRREPTGNPKRPWRYYYGDECGVAAARGLKAGDIVALGEHKVEVVEAKDGTITFKAVDGDAFFGRDPAVFAAHEVSAMFAKHFGASYRRSADRRARQAVNAVLRHVPPHLLADLTGTDAERLEQLKIRAPEVHKRLRKAFVQAGVDLSQARQVIVDTLATEGWDSDARAALIGNLLTKRGAWLAHNYRRAISAAGNLRTSGETVSATHAQAAIDIIKPGGPADNVDKLTAAVDADVKKLRKTLASLRGWQATNPTLGVAGTIEVLTALVDNPNIAQLMTVARALPGAQNKTTDAVRGMVESLQAEIPRPPSRDGAETQVYVAGPNGQPVGLPGRYKLMEAGEAIPSHKSDSFAPHPDYPEGLQERAYHRDKSEQMKVMRNAQRMKPGFLVNTNPDALNGPPIMMENGVVLGGNSRTMSMQRAYAEHPDKAKEYREYLETNMHQAGFSAADLEGMEHPILVRVVDTEGHDVNLLVRQMNESFIQQMDPRTMQVAMGRRLTTENLTELAGTMDPDETLRAYLDTSRAKGFIATLGKAGVIDDRNRSQYLKKNGKLNEDGKQLVERILVGHLIPDPDLLSNTNARMLGAIARVVPYLVQAEGSSKQYNIRGALRDALDGHIRMHDMGFHPKQGATESERATSVKDTRAQMTDLFTGDHPVLADERTGMLFDVMVRHGGPVRLAKVFREYAVQAAANPEGQLALIGDVPEPEDILRNAIATLDNKEAREEARAARTKAAVGGGGLFRSFAVAKARLEGLR
jgi:DNA (cytosine-5)-methyltransferase 1